MLHVVEKRVQQKTIAELLEIDHRIIMKSKTSNKSKTFVHIF